MKQIAYLTWASKIGTTVYHSVFIIKVVVLNYLCLTVSSN